MRQSVLLCLSLLLVFELSPSTSSVLRAVPGTRLVIPCLPNRNSFSGAKVSWTHNGNLVAVDLDPSTQGSPPVSQDGFQLTISSLSTDCQGAYECVITQNNIEWRKTYTVHVDASSSYTLKVFAGSSLNLPCERPSSSQATTYALWFKETGGERRLLSPVETGYTVDPKGPGGRAEWLYSDPNDMDQSIILHQPTPEDTGTYHCESEEGEKFNSIQLMVEVAPTTAPHSCLEFMTPWEECPDESSRSWAAMLEESLTEFSMKLYTQLSQSHVSKNLLYSPIGISTVLTHLLLGARGETRRELESALCLSHDFFCVHSAIKKLGQRLNETLKIASKIYYNSDDIKLSESFTNQSLQFYDAEPVRLSNSSDENVRQINSWVSEQTKGNIKELVSYVPSHTQLLLLNAVYFKGEWKVKFEGKSSNAVFTKLNGDIVKVPTLYSVKYKLAMEYVPNLKAKVAVFPLSGDNSLYILLPPSAKPSDLQLVEGKMTDTTLRQMVAQMKKVAPQPTEVTLPKIKLDVRTDLNPLLIKLGLVGLFEGANLCGLNQEGLVTVTDVRHHAFLSLTEQGVEAGAATSVSFSRSFSSFAALRPFVLVVWSDQANAPLFMARVSEP